MQRLIIRLGSNTSDPIHWLVFNEQEQEIIASGALKGIDDLASLSERASSAQVIALAPSSDVYFTQVDLPKNASRKVLSAIPFMLEDEVCGDVQQLFFALGNRIDNRQEVAVIHRQKLQAWQQAFSDANLFCDRLIPDTYCLPSNEGVSLLELNQQLLVKLVDGQLLQGESEWLLPLALHEANTKESSIFCYSEIDNWPDTQEAHFNFDELPMQLLLKGAVSAKLNLFQGEYAVKRKANPAWDKWKVAAALGIIAICANLIYKSTELNQLKSERIELRQQIQASIKQGFPQLNRVTNVRRVLAREMNQLEQGGGNLSMLAMLSRLGNAFESSGVKPQSIKYDSRRSELRMQTVANNFENLESFRRAAENLGFEVEQGAFNNRETQVFGVITVRG